MPKYKLYTVTKRFQENGQDLINQWTVRAKSRKEALEDTIEEEGIIIEETPYVYEKSVVHSGSETENAL